MFWNRRSIISHSAIRVSAEVNGNFDKSTCWAILRCHRLDSKTSRHSINIPINFFLQLLIKGNFTIEFSTGDSKCSSRKPFFIVDNHSRKVFSVTMCTTSVSWQSCIIFPRQQWRGVSGSLKIARMFYDVKFPYRESKTEKGKILSKWFLKCSIPILPLLHFYSLRPSTWKSMMLRTWFLPSRLLADMFPRPS